MVRREKTVATFGASILATGKVRPMEYFQIFESLCVGIGAIMAGVAAIFKAAADFRRGRPPS